MNVSVASTYGQSMMHVLPTPADVLPVLPAGIPRVVDVLYVLLYTLVQIYVHVPHVFFFYKIQVFFLEILPHILQKILKILYVVNMGVILFFFLDNVGIYCHPKPRL